jgi:hypothetical protein
MNEEQLRELIELQRELIAALQDKSTGYSMRIIEAKKRIQDFEDSLPCNQEFSDEIDKRGYFIKK